MSSKVISYGKDERQKLYVERVNPEDAHWFVVIHGGAWRDQLITYKQGEAVSEKAHSSYAHQFGGFASSDYRLSPDVQDPEHVKDCAHALQLSKKDFGVQEVTVLGHSCGAFIAGQLAEAADLALNTSNSVTKAIASFDSPKITRVIGVEGIYSSQSFVKEYKGYLEFVEEAFGKDESVWPVIPWEKLPSRVVVQSLKDEFLDLGQSLYVQKLTGAKMVVLEEGKHDEVFERETSWVESIL